ncbi:DUF6049 family protein [Streptomyces silvensis]|uniref:Uncharacterized protein n=1 Tax=Streptomyces silvensis TaxID=1765722 RepID=A0A0W7WZ19_9ACTN|nr:DUF6049 family protein [Streptomyces silvensis]KUF15792.1 hypothetical protein AT728_13805 [Streptomyces silvensis]
MAEAADFPGTSPSPARRWFRRTATLLAGAPLLAGLLQVPTSPTASAAAPSAGLAATAATHPASGAKNAQKAASRPKTAATGSRTVNVSLNSLTPSAPREGDTVTVSGTVTNEGRQTITNAQVGLRIGSPLGGRTAIDSAAKRTSYQPGADGSEVGGKYAEKFSRLAPGVRQDFSISVPVSALDLGLDGVYQLGVALTGQTSAQPYPQVLGIERTFLPWQDGAADTKTRTTFLWPLISSTHLTARTRSDEEQTPLFKDESLAKELQPGGRLQQLLALGSQLDVTWVVDPDLLVSVDAMTTSYDVQGADGTPVAGRNQAVAKQWLDQLQKAVKGKKVVALPFADPDLASLAHNGRPVTGSLGHLKEATEVGAQSVKDILTAKVSTDFAWPAEGAVDPSVVDIATSAGAHSVIARSDSLRETAGLSYTPNAARPIGGGTTAVVADARLSTAFSGDMTGAENSTLAVQEFLAQSLMVTLQDPGRQRSIVVAPQRMPTASQAQSMARALTALDDKRWSQPQDLQAAAKAQPDPDATTQVPSTGAYPSYLRKQELPRSAFQEVQDTQGKLDRFKQILSEPDRVITPFGRAMDRELATSWRGRPAQAQSFRKGVQGYLTSLTRQVKLINKSDVKLSGRSATIPVTVQNNLVQGVDHLVLRLTSTNPTRLKVGDGLYEEQPVKITGGGHTQSVKFTTTANANGPVTVSAQLYTEDGQPYGPAVRFDVNVTEFTATVMLVIGGGVLLLVLAGFRMYTQRKRAAQRRAEAGPDGGPDGDADDTSGTTPDPEPGTDDPEQPSDPTPDTAPESAEPSHTGERVDR